MRSRIARSAGKTTFLNLLRGEAHYANVSGDIHVNGVSVPDLSSFRSSVAFVPQDDVMYLELTVEECIMYSALLFNTRGLSTAEECTPMVSYILNILGIDFIRHLIVGSPAQKSISGGQRKRVSVGEFITVSQCSCRMSCSCDAYHPIYQEWSL
jgi:ABC transport system ATP-binding/permease protein